jgi:hypothetical protein
MRDPGLRETTRYQAWTALFAFHRAIVSIAACPWECQLSCIDIRGKCWLAQAPGGQDFEQRVRALTARRHNGKSTLILSAATGGSSHFTSVWALLAMPECTGPLNRPVTFDCRRAGRENSVVV